MDKTYVEEQDFLKIDFSRQALTVGEYDHCTFVNCTFNNCDLSNIIFADCQFEDCDLSLAKVSNTVFRDVKFKQCKLLGLHFENCNEFLFSVDFEGCQLNLSSFYKRALKKTNFKDCSLKEVDFAETNLINSTFDNCDLLGAIFDNTILLKCDFRTSFNFIIDPEKNQISKAKFSLQGIAGLLTKYNIIIE